MPNIEQRISEIERRNKRVELDKSWETSIIRKFIVAILTYIVIVIFFFAAKLPSPFINAIVPSVAFLISTLTLPVFKEIWIKSKK